MRLHAAIKGNLRKIVAEEWRRAGPPIRAALREAAMGVRADLKGQAEQVGLKGLGRSWRHKVYRGKRGPHDDAALVYPKGGERTRGALWAFENGTVIRPKKGRYLAIPTQFNRAGGRRGARALFQPQEITNGFIGRSRKGTLILFAKPQRAQRRRNGVVRAQAYVNDHLLGGGRVKRTREILKHGAVPMFVLVRSVRVRKRLNMAEIAKRWGVMLPRLILKHWNAVHE